MGWALGNVWYDKHDGPPPPKSPLESLFMLVKLRRMEAELLSTRALVHASLTADSHMKPVIKAYEEYADKVLPFLAAAADQEKQNEREALFKFVKYTAKIDKKYIYKRQHEALARNAKLPTKQFRMRARTPGL